MPEMWLQNDFTPSRCQIHSKTEMSNTGIFSAENLRKNKNIEPRPEKRFSFLFLFFEKKKECIEVSSGFELSDLSVMDKRK